MSSETGSISNKGNMRLGAGGSASRIPPDVVLRRIARLADGWCPSFLPDDEGRRAVALVQSLAAAAGRDPAALVLSQPNCWQDRDGEA